MTLYKTIAIYFLILFLGLSPSQADPLQDWQRHLVEGQNRTKTGDWGSAAEAFEKATEIARTYLSKAGSRLAFSQALLGNSYSHLGRDAQADLFFDRSIRLYQSQPIDDSLGFASAHSNAAKHFRLRMQYRKTIQLLQRCIEVWNAFEGGSRIMQIASAYRGLGISYFSIGEYDSAIQSFARCIEADSKYEDRAPQWKQSDGLLFVQCLIDSKNLNSADSMWRIIESESGKIDSIPEANLLLFRKVKARLFLVNGKIDECLNECRQVMARYLVDEFETEVFASDFTRIMGLAFKEIKQYDSAEVYLNRSIEAVIGRTVSSQSWKIPVQIDLAEVRFLGGTLASCGKVIESIRGFLEGDIEIAPSELARGWKVIVEYHLSRDEVTLAKIAFDKGMELLTSRYPSKSSFADQFRREFEREF